MHSYFALIIASVFAGIAAAANSTQSINPSSVPLSTRNQWCLAEFNTCPLLCGGSASTQQNDCDGQTLNYTCICNNGSSPALALYQNTLPYYICTEYVAQCITAHENDAQGQAACRVNNVCGSGNASTVAAATSTAASTAAATASSTGGATTSSTAKGSMALSLGQEYSLGFLTAGLLTAFGMLL